jgi:hypothetical protein
MTQFPLPVEAAIMKYRDILENYECSVILGKKADPTVLDIGKIEIAEAVLRHIGIISHVSDSRIRWEIAQLERLGEAQPEPRPHIPAWLRWKVYARDHYRCVYCHKRWDLSCDHKIPVSKGGETTLENLVCSCRPCNSRKGAS